MDSCIQGSMSIKKIIGHLLVGFISHIMTPHIRDMNIYHDIATTIQVAHCMFVGL